MALAANFVWADEPTPEEAHEYVRQFISDNPIKQERVSLSSLGSNLHSYYVQFSRYRNSGKCSSELTLSRLSNYDQDIDYWDGNYGTRSREITFEIDWTGELGVSDIGGIYAQFPDYKAITISGGGHFPSIEMLGGAYANTTSGNRLAKAFRTILKACISQKPKSKFD